MSNESYSLEEFEERARKGLPFVASVTARLLLANIGVLTQPVIVRGNDQSAWDFAASKDVRAFYNRSCVRVLEVKSKNERFTNDPRSWPDRFDDVLLYNARKVEKGPPPYAVILCSTWRPLEELKNEWSLTTIPTLAVIVSDVTDLKQRVVDDDHRNISYTGVTAPRSALLSWDAFIVRLRQDLADNTVMCNGERVLVP